MTAMRCRHCHDDLPSDSPPAVTTCKGYTNWKARKHGDMLTEELARTLELIAFFCAYSVATEQGLEMVPELD